MSEQTVAKDIEQAILSVLERDGYELVLVEYVPRQHLVRVFIDRPEGINVDDCSRVSHVVGDVLDAEGISDRIPGRYHLEVSSPGLDRPLVKPGDFKRYIGRQVQIATHQPNSEGRKRFTGELQDADEQRACVTVDGTVHDIAYEAMSRARLVPDI